jgi:hypothetical protein
MLLRDLQRECEAESGSALSSLAYKGQEQCLSNRLGYSRSIVGDTNVDRLFVLLETEDYHCPLATEPGRLTGV